MIDRCLSQVGTNIHGWRMPYGRCGRCHTNFARATPTYCPFVIIGYTNFDLLVNHIMFWPHQLWKPFSAHANITIEDIPFKKIFRGKLFLSRYE